MKSLLLSLVLTLTACSNPFSGHGDSKNNALPSYHTKNVSCNEIDLSTPHVNSLQLRNVVGCLNSNHEIEAFSALVSTLSDQDLDPLITWVNETADRNPRFLYAMKELYFKIQADGRLGTLEETLSTLFKDAGKDKNFAEVLNQLAPEIRKLLFDQKNSISLRHLNILTSSAAYQRLFEEVDSNFLHTFTLTLKTYLSEKDGTSIETLYRMLADNNVDSAFQSLTKTDGPVHLQKLASFLEWLFQGKQFTTLSSAVKTIRGENLTCFKGSTQVVLPFNTELKKLGQMSASEARVYLGHDLKNLILSARGYCTVPYSLDALTHFLSEAVDRPGFDEIFTLVNPLIDDDRFIDFIASTASRNWVAQNQYLADHHFFADLLTLVSLDLRFPLTDQPTTLAHFLDQAFLQLSQPQAEKTLHDLSPVFSVKEKYGNKTAALLDQIQTEFPTIETHYKMSPKLLLGPFLETVLKRDQLSTVFVLVANLIDSKKLNGFLDETFNLFRNFMNRGKFDLAYGVFAFPHFKTEDSYFWKLNKFKPLKADSSADLCSGLNFDWSFINYSPNAKTLYLKQMDLIQKCIDPNQTFKSALDFATYAINQGSYSYLLGLQNDVISELFRLNSKLLFNTVYAFLDVSPDQSKIIREGLTIASETTALLGPELKKATELRAALSRQFASPDFFAGASDFLHLPDRPQAAPKPALDLMALNTINAMYTKDESAKNENFEAAVTQFIHHYCPSLNTHDAACDLDDDQVILYQQSPSALVQQIKSEFLSSFQSWLHPKQLSHWNHTETTAQTISEFEYHYHPLLHLLRSDANATQSVFNAIKRLQDDQISLSDFLQERGIRLTLIPYVFQLPNYPGSSKMEFHTRIRIRIVSDLDRLELIAINADFKALGLTQNFGLGFIRDIGLSWGDEPTSKWPSDLSHFVKPSDVQTLSQTRDHIHSMLNRFDVGLLQKMGECDPRGHTQFGRWIQSQFCNNEVHDISARLFNLRFLISLIDEELPPKDGGRDGLRLLRDLFYSLYSANHSAQIDNFPNDMVLPSECLTPPPAEGALPQCQYDLLTLISRITRMGLLHQVGMNVLQNQNTSVPDFITVINRLAADPLLTQGTVDLTSSASGVTLLQSAKQFGFHAESGVGSSLASLVQIFSRLQSVHWLQSVLDLTAGYPSFLDDYGTPIRTTLLRTQTALENANTYLTTTHSSKLKSWLDTLSSSSNSKLNQELLKMLEDLKPNAGKLTALSQQALDLPMINNASLKTVGVNWFETLSLSSSEPTRKKIANWVVNDEFNSFCDVFSDPTLVNQTYNFLESINQNPDSKTFFKAAESFINNH